MRKNVKSVCLFDLEEENTINFGNNDIKEFTKNCLGEIKINDLLTNPEFFLQNENNKDDLLSLFFHSYESNIEDKKSNFDESENTQKRYFADTRICYNCGEIGHIDSKCPKRISKICILCGSTDHIRYNCPLVICSKCGFCGHRFKDCRENIDRRKRYNFCFRCPNKHIINDCSYHWRKYRYNRLDSKQINKCCCYCLSSNHFIDDCHIRKSKNSIFTVKYEEMLNTYGPSPNGRNNANYR